MPGDVGLKDAIVLADAPAARPPVVFEPLTRTVVLMRKRLGNVPFARPEAILLEMREESEIVCPTLMPEVGEMVGVAAVRSGSTQLLPFRV